MGTQREPWNMTRVELQGWIQVGLSIFGILVTVWTAGPALDAVGTIATGAELPSAFRGATGVLTIFLLMLLLMTFLMMLMVGLGSVLTMFFRRMDAAMPGHAAFSLVAAVIILAMAATTAVFQHPSWLPLLLVGAACLVGAGLAGWDRTGHRFWVSMTFFWGVALIGGLWLAAVSGGVFEPVRTLQPENVFPTVPGAVGDTVDG